METTGQRRDKIQRRSGDRGKAKRRRERIQ